MKQEMPVTDARNFDNPREEYMCSGGSTEKTNGARRGSAEDTAILLQYKSGDRKVWSMC